MVNFGLGKEIEKDVFRLETSVEQRIILSPYEESNLRPSGSALRCSTTEPERLYGNVWFNSAERQFWVQSFLFFIFVFFQLKKRPKHAAAKMNGCWSTVSSENCLSYEDLSILMRLFRHSATNFFTSLAENKASFFFSQIDSFPFHLSSFTF